MIKACPECDSPSIRYREGTGDYRCTQCKMVFEAPTARTKKSREILPGLEPLSPNDDEKLVRACPSCNSTRLLYRKLANNFTCHNCETVFTEPAIRTVKKHYAKRIKPQVPAIAVYKPPMPTIPKISPAELSIEQTERIERLAMTIVVQKAAQKFLRDDLHAYRDVCGESHTLRLTDPKICSELWHRSHEQKIDIDELIEDILWAHFFPNEMRTQLSANKRSRNWREAKRKQPTVSVCPHCGSQNFGHPLMHRGEWICFTCRQFFRQPVKKEFQRISAQSNSSKSSNEPAEEILDEQKSQNMSLKQKQNRKWNDCQLQTADFKLSRVENKSGKRNTKRQS